MTITEVSKRYDLTTDTLRYYERIGLIPRVRKNQSGIRDYTEEDCEWVGFTKCMRSAGVQIEALIEFVELFQKGDCTKPARQQLMMEQRDRLQEKMDAIRISLERMNHIVEQYDETVGAAEKRLRQLETHETTSHCGS